MASLSAREQAYQTIRSRIITMELKPGDPLNDRELAEQMGISRTPMREALIMLNIAHMVDIKPQSGTHVAPIDLKRMELEQFARFTLEKEILNRVRGRLTDQQEQEYRQIIENYRLLEADLTQPNRETRLLELDNQFHRKAFEITGMEAHLTTCWVSCSMWSASASSACRPTRTNPSAPPTPAFWKWCCTAPPMNWAKRWKAT